MKEAVRVIIKPLVTEKSNGQKETGNQIAFVVDGHSNKIEIGHAVEQAFKVKVLKVRTLNMTGKHKRIGRTMGKRADWKKAVVTLAPGDRIDFFEGV
jgi:large subunit ribosomal protein L23